MMHRALAPLSLFVLVAGCHAVPPPAVPPPPEPPPSTGEPPPAASKVETTPDADFRKQAPAAGAEITFVPPVIQETKLSNGIRVLLVERHDLPLVAIRIASNRGAEVAGTGIGSFAGALLMSGTKTRDALAISDAFQSLGADSGGWASFDDVSVSARVLSSKLGDVLPLLADVLQSPTFPAAEVDRERSRRLTELSREKDVPGRLLAATVAGLLYPPHHPYHDTLLGTEAAVKHVSSADLSAFYRQTMEPDAITIAVAGDVRKDALLPELEKSFGKWKGTAGKTKPPAAPPAWDGKGARIILVDRPGASQSNVQVVLPGVPRSTKDYDAVVLMNTILGGQFSSRLNLNLREKHAYTYGAGSGFDMRHGPGPFGAGGAIVRESTAPAVKEILAELDAIRKAPVSDEELADAKESLIKALPARFETASETAQTLASLAVYGLPLDEFATRPARWSKVSKEDVQRVAKAYLDQDRMRVVIVGDAAKIKDELQALGVGPIDVRAPATPADAKHDKAAEPHAASTAATPPKATKVPPPTKK